jgi:hypothetical protein
MRTMLALALTAATPAFAAPGTDTCPSDGERAELQAFTDRLAAAGTADEAKDLALDKIRLGQKSIHRAEKLVGDRAGLAEAQAKLDALEAQVRAADTQAEVASAFGGLDQSAGCDYTTTEIVVIVIGFVLGIIPGIIFLFLFC